MSEPADRARRVLLSPDGPPAVLPYRGWRLEDFVEEVASLVREAIGAGHPRPGVLTLGPGWKALLDVPLACCLEGDDPDAAFRRMRSLRHRVADFGWAAGDDPALEFSVRVAGWLPKWGLALVAPDGRAVVHGLESAEVSGWVIER